MIRLVALLLALAPTAGSAEGLVLASDQQWLVIHPAAVQAISSEAFGAQIDLTVTLTPKTVQALAAFTAGLVGRNLVIMSCGAELTRLRLVERITGGALVIGGLTDPVARRLVALLQAHVKAVIAPYKYPRRVLFIEALPKTQTGKIQRFRLKG